VIGCIGAVYRV
jgi:hypothetical protein